MKSPKHSEGHPGVEQKDADEMAKYGITRVSVNYFHYGDFRYTNLADAIAQAKRQQPASPSEEQNRS
jgi:hypothetical protein